MELMTPTEVAKRLRCSTRRARTLMAAGVVPVVWLGKRSYSPKVAFDRWWVETVEHSLATVRATAAERELARAS